jgi:ketosteroid isomerase-like protein
MPHPNEDVVRAAYDAFTRGSMNDIPFADGITFNVYGSKSNPMAGVYKGKAEVFAFLQKVMERSEGTFKLEAHDILGGPEHVVGLTTHTGRRGGKDMKYHSVHVWHVQNNQLTELFEFAQEPDFDNFWA